MLRMAPAKAGEISLDYHLTLEVMRSGVGDQYHLGSMAQATYMAMLLHQAGNGQARPGLFVEAEQAILRCRQHGIETGVWLVDEETYVLLGEILTLFDQQLAVVSLHELMLANGKLKKIFRSTPAP